MNYHLKSKNMNNQITPGTILNVLFLEDSLADFEIISEHLATAGFNLNVNHVKNENEFSSALDNCDFDIILADFRLPGFDAFGALKIHTEKCAEIPFICVSGSIGEEQAVELLKQGATDYVLKDRLGRLSFAIVRALNEVERLKVIKTTEESLQKKAKQLQTFYELTVGRELKMVELKKEINELLKNAGLEAKY